MALIPDITGIICTHNRERFLERCIRSLLTQSLDSVHYEILVVDNGSTDTTRQICEKFSGYKNFRYVYEPVLGLSSARNTGWRQAKGKYVGYLDDDATAVHTWFEKALWSFENVEPMPEWVGGPIDLEWEVDAPAWITAEYQETLGFVNWGNSERLLSGSGERLGGGNSFYQKSILVKMQGFDTRLGRKKTMLLSGEETQFQHRLKSLGGKLFYHPDVRIFHFVGKERTKPQFFYKRYYWGGITDYLMSRTLKDEEVSFEHIDQEQNDESQVGRLIINIMKSAGLFVSENEKIKSRIYMSYVFGWLVAVSKFGWRKLELEQL